MLCKYPYTIDEFFSAKYNDYIKIFIVRNPLYVFSSLNKRFNYAEPEKHNVNSYIKTLKKFIYYCEKPVKNLYTIRYEDLFENNYQNYFL